MKIFQIYKSLPAVTTADNEINEDPQIYFKVPTVDRKIAACQGNCPSYDPDP